MNLDKKKIGIWGFGVVGKAALTYFKKYNIPTSIMDEKEPEKKDYELIKHAQSSYVPQSQCIEFLNNNDVILASPGIDLRPFSSYHDKFITELDLFAYHNKNKTIAITGTIAKTSITHLLSTVLKKHTTINTGGNIGTGMLELLTYQEQATMSVLELSSFQLEHCKSFAPDLAIWTNFYPNHLDRHTTVEEYFNAKYTVLAYQTKNQQALVPLELAKKIVHKKSHNPNNHATLHFFSPQKPCLHQFDWLPHNSTLFWLEDNAIIHYKDNIMTELISLDTVPKKTFTTNWLIISAALYLLDIPLTLLSPNDNDYSNLEHRIEKVADSNGIEFYNDSKSTIMESTIAAVDQLQKKPIILFLGGLSKGVNREPYIKKLYGKVKHLVCFGKEADNLHQYAQESSLESSKFQSLDDAFNFVQNIAKSGDQIIFSPGGSSYDLYTNYKDRGEHFKTLIKKYYQ